MNKTNEKIINAFLEISKDRPISDITIKDISIKANINRSTFYNYFLDIDDLIEQVENDIVIKIKDKAIDSLSKKEITYEMVFNLISDIFTDYEEYIYILLIKNNNMGFYDKLKKDFFPIIEQYMGIKTNIKNFDYVTSYVFNSILGLITHWYDTGKEMPLEDFVSLMFSLIRDGVAKYL